MELLYKPMVREREPNDISEITVWLKNQTSQSVSLQKS